METVITTLIVLGTMGAVAIILGILGLIIAIAVDMASASKLGLGIVVVCLYIVGATVVENFAVIKNFVGPLIQRFS